MGIFTHHLGAVIGRPVMGNRHAQDVLLEVEHDIELVRVELARLEARRNEIRMSISAHSKRRF